MVKDNVVRAITMHVKESERKFRIEIGIHFDFLSLKRRILPFSISTSYFDYKNRLTPNGESDYWWDFPKDENESKLLIGEIRTMIPKKLEQDFENYESW